MPRPCDGAPVCIGCEPCGVEPGKRDLLKDKAICAAATPGPSAYRSIRRWVSGRED